MSSAVKFVGGDEVVEPFLIESSEGNIIDLSGLTVTGSIWWRGKSRIALTVIAGIEIENLFPARNNDPDLQEPHGNIRLSEVQTALIPYGRISSLRMRVVTPDSVTMSSYLAPLERVP